MIEKKPIRGEIEVLFFEGVPSFYQKQLCQFLGINQRTFQNWNIVPCLIEGTRKYYRVADVIAFFEAKAEARDKEQIFYDENGNAFTIFEVEAAKKKAEQIALEFKVQQFMKNIYLLKWFPRRLTSSIINF